MVILYADSQNQVRYTTYLSGVPRQADTTPTVVLSNHNGAAVALSNIPQWSSTLNCYLLTIVPSEVPSSAIGRTWQFKWTWSISGQTFSETDFTTIVSNEIGWLCSALRRKIRDAGNLRTDYLNGDGITTAFNLISYPIDAGSELVLVGGSSLPSSGYTIGLDTGRLTFSTAPSLNVLVTVTYVYHNYSRSDIESYVGQGIVHLNNSIGSSYSIENPVLTDWEKQVVLLYAMRELYVDEMLAAASNNITWRDGEKSVSKTGVSSAYKDSIGLLEEKIKSTLNEKAMKSTTGVSLTGGYTSIKFDEIDWERVNERTIER